MKTPAWLEREAHARDFYAKLGFAFSEAQILERAVMGVLSSHMVFTKSGRVTKETLAELVQKIERRTFGPLLKEMKDAFTFTDRDLTKLKEALKLRNDLAHGFLWRNANAMIAPRGLEKLTAELDEIVQVIFEATRIADSAFNALLERAGLNGPEYEATFQMYLREEYERIRKG